MKMSIGFDVSKVTLDVVLYNGQTLKHFKVDNEEKGYEIILHAITEYSALDIGIIMEATGVYHQRAANYFYRKGYAVYVVNPIIIKRYSQMKMLRAKTDKIDAEIIAQYGFYEEAHPYMEKSEKSLKIQGFLKAIDDLTQMKVQNKNRLEALNYCSINMEDVELMYQRINEHIAQEIVRMEKEILSLSKEISLKAYQNVCTIPGVGKRIAPAIIGYFGQMEDFETAKQLACFIGISPSVRMSGTSVRGKGSISKKGNNYIRKQLYMASLTACRYNAPCKALYTRLIEKGKSKKAALIAVSHKLARQIFAVTKYERRYDPNFNIT